MANRPYTPLPRAPQARPARKGAGDTTQSSGDGSCWLLVEVAGWSAAPRGGTAGTTGTAVVVEGWNWKPGHGDAAPIPAFSRAQEGRVLRLSFDSSLHPPYGPDSCVRASEASREDFRSCQ